MTEEQINTAKRLSHCIFLPGSYDKRFCRTMANYAEYEPDRELTPKQEALLKTMKYRYRQQIEEINP